MIKVGDKFNTRNNGTVSVIKYDGVRKITVRFDDTGYTTTVQGGNLRCGNIKDLLKPSVHGVGYVGVGKYKATENGKSTLCYYKWQNMLTRCYCPVYQSENPNYLGCAVDERWHNFQNFAEWHYENYFEGAQLDKDLSAYGTRGKLYSPETCAYVTTQVNVEEAHAKSWKFINPDGDAIDIYNLRKFCHENGLSQSRMWHVHNGSQISHKGWKRFANYQ